MEATNEATNPPKRDSDYRRETITKFTWDMAVDYFESKTLPERTGILELYLHDNGQIIDDPGYLKCINIEVCRQFGLQLLEVLVDLIHSVGFGYPSLISNLPSIVDDAFKPICKTAARKIVVWVEDEKWNSSTDSLLEPLVGQLILEQSPISLITPMKYFDKQVLSTAFNISEGHLHYNPNPSGMEDKWKTFSSLLKFAFLLSIRSKECSIVILHFSQQFAEKVDAFSMLDLAEAEGHTVKYFRNIVASATERRRCLENFVSEIVNERKCEKKKNRVFSS